MKKIGDNFEDLLMVSQLAIHSSLKILKKGKNTPYYCYLLPVSSKKTILKKI